MKTDYTREELIDICDKAIVSQDKWQDRDSAMSQIKLGKAYALLKAGCHYEIKTKEKYGDGCTTDEDTIWIQFWVKDFHWWEHGDDQDPSTEFDKYGTKDHAYHYYLPTPKRLDEAKGGDWY